MAVDNAVLLDELLRDYDITDIGIPVFAIDTNKKREIYDHVMYYDVYLGMIILW